MKTTALETNNPDIHLVAPDIERDTRRGLSSKYLSPHGAG